MIYLRLFFEFFKVGLFTIGGGYAMIPLVKEVVLKYGWVEESLFYDFLGVCESTPGPIAINMATYVGSVNGGVLGGIAATLGVVLPSFIIITLIAMILKNLTKNKFFIRTIEGVKPIIVGLITATGFVMCLKSLGYDFSSAFDFNFRSLIILAIIVGIYFFFKQVLKKKISVILLIIISAGLGIIINII